MSDDNPHGDILNQAAQGQLKSIIERIERLEQEKAEVAEQIKEVFAEAKGNGFDVKVLRKVVRIRKQDRAKRLEEEARKNPNQRLVPEFGSERDFQLQQAINQLKGRPVVVSKSQTVRTDEKKEN